MNSETPEAPTAVTKNLDERFPSSLQQFACEGLDAIVGTIREPLFQLGLLISQAAMFMCPELTETEARNMFAQALSESLAKHPDLPTHAEAMTIAVLGLLPYTNRISAAEYVEGHLLHRAICRLPPAGALAFSSFYFQSRSIHPMTTPFPSLVQGSGNNPIIDELDAMSPQAKGALHMAHTAILGQAQQPQEQLGATGGHTPDPAPLAMAPKSPVPSLGAPMQSGQATAPSAGPAPMAPPSMAPPSLSPHQAELGRLQQTGSGISQIHNPVLRGLAQVGDAIGGGLFPGIEQRLPGTQGYHNLLLHQAQNAVQGDDLQAKNAADLQGEQLAAENTRASTEHTRAETEAINNPPGNVKAEELLYDHQGNPIGYRDAKGTYYGPDDPKLPPGVSDVLKAAHSPQSGPSIHALPDGKVISVHTDPKTGKSTSEVVYEGDPKVETELAKLEVGGKPHSVIVNKKTGATIKDLGETGEKTPTVNVNAGTAALDRESGRFGKSWEKAVADANTQLDKINDARAMINGNAESQSLGVPKILTALVSGAGSGVRITQAELNQIAHARGLSGDIEGFVNKISGKGALTSTQQKQLTGILDDVKSRITQKQQIANEALDNINGGRSRDEIVQHDSNARKKLAELERGDQQAGGSQGHVIQVNGKHWRYNGSGATDDMKNYTEVK